MKMVVVLRSGVELQFPVEKFEIARGKMENDLRSITWTTTSGSRPTPKWFNLEEVVAVYAK